MWVEIDFNVVSQWLGGASCILLPAIGLVWLFGRYRIVRRDAAKCED